jgi:4-hydroxybutyryl-CoA dehydratase/vinylacetyl-CoA-Delta-isomerase
LWWPGLHHGEVEASWNEGCTQEIDPLLPKESEKDYAVGFFTPVDTEGVAFICRSPHTPVGGKEVENPYSSKHGGHVESMVVFDNVFVPWERVYLCGEYDLVPTYRSVFFASHVMHKCMCRWSGIDLAIGAAALVADYNGLQGMSNIQEELAEMMVNAEIVQACALASALEGSMHPSGVFVPRSFRS